MASGQRAVPEGGAEEPAISAVNLREECLP